MKEKGFALLQKSLIDNIKEQQAKLGYRKEKIYFYYPLSSLRHFFSENCSEEEMLKILSDFPIETTEKLGTIRVSSERERFCFEIPEEGSEYVHQHENENEFISALIQLVAQHGCTMDEVIGLFKSYSTKIIVCKIENGEFDYKISFKENEEDPYLYCFHEEGSHLIYHRFLPEDYEDFGFEIG